MAYPGAGTPLNREYIRTADQKLMGLYPIEDRIQKPNGTFKYNPRVGPNGKILFIQHPAPIQRGGRRSRKSRKSHRKSHRKSNRKSRATRRRL
jgi:hypothetical protein